MNLGRPAVRWSLFVFLLCLSASTGLAQQAHLDVAITVDDLPQHGDLPPGMTRSDIAKSMIATFKAKGVPEVYGFMNAKRIGDDPDRSASLKLWVDAGLPLGSHTFSHMDLTKHSAEEFETEIAEDEPFLETLMGARDWHWFRYPYLHEGDTIEKRHAISKYLLAHNYKVAEVTLDFEDYAWNNPYARCVAKKDADAIAWLKQSYLSTATEYISLGQKMAVQLYGRDITGAFDSVMLPELLDLLMKQGFQFVTLPEAEKDPAYLRDPDAAFKDGGTLLDQLMEAQHLKFPPHTEKPLKKLDEICR
jgi:peptidoglycan-N-acetylglucosamine deacetylase